MEKKRKTKKTNFVPRAVLAAAFVGSGAIPAVACGGKVEGDGFPFTVAAVFDATAVDAVGFSVAATLADGASDASQLPDVTFIVAASFDAAADVDSVDAGDAAEDAPDAEQG